MLENVFEWDWCERGTENIDLFYFDYYFLYKFLFYSVVKNPKKLISNILGKLLELWLREHTKYMAAVFKLYFVGRKKKNTISIQVKCWIYFEAIACIVFLLKNTQENDQNNHSWHLCDKQSPKIKRNITFHNCSCGLAFKI